uniref:Conjugal transfer protein TrbJ n=1 Tax=Steinernema glaseri TaxID=37863 RepID=A0A1I8AN88_9BILA
MQTSKNRIFNRWTLRSLALAASIITVSIPPVQAEHHDCHRVCSEDAQADRAVPDPVAAVRKPAAKHDGPGRVYLGSGADHDQPADCRAKHAGLLREPVGQPGSLPGQVPGRGLLPQLACFNGSGGCTDAERAAMAENRRLASESQKRANDALFQTVADQQKALKDDARTLERLQGAAQGAQGQLQAIGYANQLASQQANQLLQIRTMLTAQHNAEAARIAAELDAEARGDARAEQMRTWTFRPSPADNY